MIKIPLKLTISLVMFILISSGSALADEWYMFQHDAQHTGVSLESAPNMDNVMWSAPIGDINQSSPAFAKGRLYIGSTDGNLYCLDADPSEGTDERPIDDPEGVNYDLIWTFPTGNSILSSPAFFDGKMYFGSNDGNIYCIYSCIGTEIWQFNTSGSVVSSPAIVNDFVYVGSLDGTIYCLNADNNPDDLPISYIHWTNTTGGPIRSSPAVYNGYVYIGSDSGYVYSYYANSGIEQWRSNIGSSISSSPSVDDDNVYIGADDGTVYCLNIDTGLIQWEFSTANKIVSTPAITQNYIYFGSHNGTIYCVDIQSGVEQWSYPTGGSISSSPVVADEKVYIGSSTGILYCLNASDGLQIWNFDAQSPMSSSPAIIYNRAYIASDDGNIYCFRDHNPPKIPEVPDGPTEGLIGEEYTFLSSTTDPEGDEIYFMFDWGNGKTTEWLGPYPSGKTITQSYTYKAEGTYEVRVKSKDSYGYESDWSESTLIHIGILKIIKVRGGIGIHAELQNIGVRQLWRINWNMSYIGGRVLNPAIDEWGDEILNLEGGGTVQIRSGPFFEIGRIKISIGVTEKEHEQYHELTVNAFAFGYFIFLLPY